MASVGYMPDIAGYKMSFCTSHFPSILLIGQFWGKNRSIKTISETFLNHFIRNVNYLAWPDPRAYPKLFAHSMYGSFEIIVTTVLFIVFIFYAFNVLG